MDPAAPVRFAVDLFDVGESTITPGSAATLERLGSAVASGSAGGAGGDRPPARDDLWFPLAAIALALLALEALAFQRDALVRGRRWIAARLGRGGSSPAAPSAPRSAPAGGGASPGSPVARPREPG